jgi:hypothetical protein
MRPAIKRPARWRAASAAHSRRRTARSFRAISLIRTATARRSPNANGPAHRRHHRQGAAPRLLSSKNTGSFPQHRTSCGTNRAASPSSHGPRAAGEPRRQQAAVGSRLGPVRPQDDFVGLEANLEDPARVFSWLALRVADHGLRRFTRACARAPPSSASTALPSRGSAALR